MKLTNVSVKLSERLIVKMRIVIDTNVLISVAFYAGFVKKFFDELGDEYTICGNSKIIEEYHKIKEKMISKNLGKFNVEVFDNFLEKVQSFEIKSDLKICRDPDDDKFIDCAIDAKAIYIVSGDNDLLTIKNFAGIEIVIAKEFYEKYLA